MSSKLTLRFSSYTVSNLLVFETQCISWLWFQWTLLWCTYCAVSRCHNSQYRTLCIADVGLRWRWSTMWFSVPAGRCPQWTILLQRALPPACNQSTWTCTVVPLRTCSTSVPYWSTVVCYQLDLLPNCWLLFDKPGWVLTVRRVIMLLYLSGLVHQYSCSDGDDYIIDILRNYSN